MPPAQKWQGSTLARAKHTQNSCIEDNGAAFCGISICQCASFQRTVGPRIDLCAHTSACAMAACPLPKQGRRRHCTRRQASIQATTPMKTGTRQVWSGNGVFHLVLCWVSSVRVVCTAASLQSVHVAHRCRVCGPHRCHRPRLCGSTLVYATPACILGPPRPIRALMQKTTLWRLCCCAS